MSAENENRRKLHEAALGAPKSSGVYMWKDENGVIIYIGKAKSLRNRLLSYFNSKDIKTRILISRAVRLEYITTGNEYEALILENNLIKQHNPRYNINLKDGKTYPFLRVTNEAFPRIFRTRSMKNDGSKYFGPFPDVGALDAFLDFIGKTYPLRKCKMLRRQEKPCLYYHMGQCAAPCCGKITEEAYRGYLDEALLFLEQDGSGSRTAGVDVLTAEMKKAASARLFEKAARLRDGIRAISTLRERNSVEDLDPEARDYIAWAEEGSMISFAVLRMRSGKLVSRDVYRTRTLKEAGEILPEFLVSFYTDKNEVPPRIFVPEPESVPLAEEWLRRHLESPAKITVIRPQGWGGSAAPSAKDAETAETAETAAEPGAEYGVDIAATDSRHAAAMNMAYFNAKEDAARRLRERGDFPALEELQRILQLPALPARIEGFDIAHIGGKFPVASLVSFKDGNPDKKNYRWFRLKTTDGAVDDFASVREAVSRRYTRLLNEHAELPDLVLIDGGIGQVNAAHGVLSALGLDLPVAGLAKRDEEIYRPGNSVPIRLPRRSDALRLLQRVRDETHRFATGKNQRLRTQENTRLAFETLPGVGPVLARRMLDAFGGVSQAADAVRAQGASALTAALKIPEEKARAIAAGLETLAAGRNSLPLPEERPQPVPPDISAGDLARLADED